MPVDKIWVDEFGVDWVKFTDGTIGYLATKFRINPDGQPYQIESHKAYRKSVVDNQKTLRERIPLYQAGTLQ